MEADGEEAQLPQINKDQTMTLIEQCVEKKRLESSEQKREVFRRKKRTTSNTTYN